mmetsp:Transcript_29599/g.48843  ORF Transcript_29599/g.48843 Transcript_29599/m.48843 type:complete len:231 (-) Transcript_29599:229-921(-)
MEDFDVFLGKEMNTSYPRQNAPILSIDPMQRSHVHLPIFNMHINVHKLGNRFSNRYSFSHIIFIRLAVVETLKGDEISKKRREVGRFIRQILSIRFKVLNVVFTRFFRLNLGFLKVEFCLFNGNLKEFLRCGRGVNVVALGSDFDVTCPVARAFYSFLGGRFNTTHSECKVCFCLADSFDEAVLCLAKSFLVVRVKLLFSFLFDFRKISSCLFDRILIDNGVSMNAIDGL